MNRHLANEGEEELTSKSMVSSRMRCLGFSTSSARERNRIALHRQLRSKNLALQEERDRLKAQLEEAKGDVAVWREKVDREREDKMREGDMGHPFLIEIILKLGRDHLVPIQSRWY